MRYGSVCLRMYIFMYVFCIGFFHAFGMKKQRSEKEQSYFASFIQSAQQEGNEVKSDTNEHSEHSQFTKSFYYRKKEIEALEQNIERLAEKHEALKNMVDQRRYNYVLNGVEISFKPVSILREGAKLFDRDGCMYFEKYGLKPYSKSSTIEELVNALCHMYLTQADILKDEIMPDFLYKANVYVGSQITRYIGCGEDIVAEYREKGCDSIKHDGLWVFEEQAYDRKRIISQKLKDKIDTNLNMPKEELFAVLHEKTMRLKECFADLQLKEQLTNTYKKLEETVRILEEVLQKNRTIGWLRNYFDEKETKSRRIINRKSEILLFQRRMKYFVKEIEYLKRALHMPETQYSAVMQEVEKEINFLYIFSQEVTVDQLKDRLKRSFAIVFTEQSTKKDLLQAFSDISMQQYCIALQENMDEKVLFQPSIEAGAKKKNLPRFIEMLKKTASQKKMLTLVQNNYKKLQYEYKELKEKEELYNVFNKTVKIVRVLECMHAQNQKK